jgi:hypothetical protein
LSAFSYPVAAALAKRTGLVNTMVYTHIPSSIFLILAAFSPNLILTPVLLLVRSALSQMDVPTRTSYVMAVVTPAERTAAASVTAVPPQPGIVDQPGLQTQLSWGLRWAFQAVSGLLAPPPHDCYLTP